MAQKTAEIKATKRASGLMHRLRSDVRGNAMILTAAAIIPLAGLIGGGVDVARVYAVKSRLQHACDAGALATRRSMSGSTPTAADISEGNKYFNFNFRSGMFGVPSSKVSKGFTAGSAPGTINGSATAEVDFTMMRIFDFNSIDLDVSCTATVSIPNTDIMFVLDVTGSMEDTPTGDTSTKLAALQVATKDFFRELGPGTASGAGRIRYGFVPYSSSVNVGDVVGDQDSSWILGGTTGETAQYPTRTPVTETEYYISALTPETAQSYGAAYNSTITFSSWTNYGTSGSTTVTGVAYTNRFTNITTATCSAKSSPLDTDASTSSAVGPTFNNSNVPTHPATTQTNNYRTTQNFTRTDYGYGWTRTSGSGSSALGTCQFRRRTAPFVRTTPSTTTQTATWSERLLLAGWTYGLADVDVSPFVQNGSGPNPSYWTGLFKSGQSNNPGGSYNGSSATINWNGCIEESATVNTITGSSTITEAPSGAKDLLIDLVPSSASEKWKPQLRQLNYYNSYDYGTMWYGHSSLLDGGFGACPSPASKLRSYAGDVDGSGLSSSFGAYVDSLNAIGGTYHDIGLIWGARLLSPDGIMASENADSTAPGGFQISRHLVFMTDGYMSAGKDNLDAWGINAVQGRVLPSNSSSTDLTAAHTKRMTLICDAAKRKGFTIWVIGFGIPSLTTELSNCATDTEHASVASNSTALKAKFKAIAETIGGLRLSQ